MFVLHMLLASALTLMLMATFLAPFVVAWFSLRNPPKLHQIRRLAYPPGTVRCTHVSEDGRSFTFEIQPHVGRSGDDGGRM